MKTVSQKQFETAVQKVLNGGSSKLISSREEKPFGWSKSKGHFNPTGKMPENSKFLRNDARGGRASDLYLVCYLAPGYTIAETKAEAKKRIAKAEKIKKEKNAIATSKRQAEAKRMKELAAKNGFASVAKMKEAQAEISQFNNDRHQRAKDAQMEKFIAENGEYNGWKVTDRVKLSRIELVFDCERKEDLF